MNLIILAFLGGKVAELLAGSGLVAVIGVAVTVLRKKGYIQTLKFWSKKLSVITQEIGEAFMETSDVFEKIDEAINENGKLKESNVKEVIAEGKEAIVEWKDVVVSIKPKK